MVGVAVLAGCCPQPRPEPAPVAYHGPTDSIDVVVERVNRNAQRVPSLWTTLDFTASIVDAHGRRTDASGDGALMYRRPASLLLSGDKDVAGQVFQLGCNGTEFWVKLRTSASSADYYWGHLANVGRPGCAPVPIRPDGVVEVLGVGLLRTNLLEQPTPVMRFDNDRDAYVFDFNVRLPDRWVTRKEVWYDRKTARPRRVALYDDAGRLVLRADLSRHEPMDLPDVPADRRPVVARRYDLWFPDTGSTMALNLTEAALTHANRRGTVLPNDDVFDRHKLDHEPDPHDHVVQVDAGVEASP